MQTKLIASFTVPQLPISYTKALNINYRTKGMFLSQAGRNYKTLVKRHVPPIEQKLTATTKIVMHNEYYSDWHYKNKKIKKKDVQNLNRLLIDAVFSKIGIDDSHLFKVTDEKIQSDKDKVVINLWTVKDDKYELKA